MPLKGGIGNWVKDFKKSDAPQFKGKSDEKKRDMAIAAYLDAKNEERSVSEATAKVDYFIGHKHAKRAGIGVKVHRPNMMGGDDVSPLSTLQAKDMSKIIQENFNATANPVDLNVSDVHPSLYPYKIEPVTSENQVGITTGDHAGEGTVLAHKADQVWRHKDGLAPGFKMHWLLPATQANTQVGSWSSSSASSGLTNLENDDTKFDWSYQTNTSEEIDALKGFSFNTGNANYSATKWTDPNPGSTKISIRYHANNTIDLYDESNGAIIATKDVNGDGNPVYISWCAGGDTANLAQLNDDFFGGGDVGIAVSTATV